MRCTQIMGLPPKALKFIEDNVEEIPDIVCPHCDKVVSYKKECKQEIYASAKKAGMFDDGPELYRYIMQDGSTWIEMVQEVPWSSGPCVFLMLVNVQEQKKRFKWERSEMNERM